MRACGAGRRPAPQPTLRYGELEIDPAARTVLRAARRWTVRARVLGAAGAAGGAAARAVARRRSRPSSTTGRALDSNAIEVHVHRLRRKLGEGVVRTVRGVGYYVPAEPAA
jgi:two-component system OmpR family response regulator/two-component system response regulator QseB